MSNGANANASLIENLKTTIIKKDIRIEYLEHELKIHKDRLSASTPKTPGVLDSPVSPEFSVSKDDPFTITEPKSATAPALKGLASSTAANYPANHLFTTASLVRLEAPVVGIHPDGWAEPYVCMKLLSQSAITRCTMIMWSPPRDRSFTTIKFYFDGSPLHVATAAVAEITEIKIPMNVPPGTNFKLEFDCADVATVPPPDIRRLSYIIRELVFS